MRAFLAPSAGYSRRFPARGAQGKTMHRVLILGAGKIGALISGLLAESGSYKVHLADVDGHAAEAVVRAHGAADLSSFALDAKDIGFGSMVKFTRKDCTLGDALQADLETLLPAVRQIIHQADPEPISNIRTIEDVLAGETESRTIQMRVLVVFTGVAILLAGLGIYGLLAFTVSMRQQEFGIRVALGAGHGDIFKMVLFQGARLALAGLLPGLRALTVVCGPSSPSASVNT